MKGILVPLLMLWMTGTVAGQQANSNVFRSSVYRPQSQSDTQGSSVSQPQSDASKIKPLDLSVSDEDIQGIRNGAELLSIIEPRDPNTQQLLPLGVVSGITLIHKKNLNKQLPIRKMTGEVDGNGKIKFGLDNWALSDLENSRLSFVFPLADRGKYDRVAFYYKATTAVPGATPVAGSGSDFGSPPDSPGIGFGQTKQGLSFLPPPGPEALPGDVDFVGPVMPSASPTIANNNRPGTWNPTTRITPDETLNNQGLEFNRTKESLTDYQNRLLRESLEQDQNDRQQQQLRDLARIERNNTTQQPRLENSIWPNAPNPTQRRQSAPVTAPPNLPKLNEQEIADRLALIQRQRQIQAEEDALAAREADLKRRKDEFEWQRILESRKLNQIDELAPSVSSRFGNVADSNVSSQGPGLGRSDRLAMNTDFKPNQPSTAPQRSFGGVRNMAAMLPPPSGVNGDTGAPNESTGGIDPMTQQKKEKRTEGFIYFMLLCSLGLNVYLGLISRGFYVRYNELADELRETFTATM